MKGNRLLLAGIVIGSLVLFVALASLAPRAVGGSEPLRAFYRAMGADVQEQTALPATDTVLVLERDFRTPEQADDVLTWVEDGGRLIVTDPSSSVLHELDIDAPGSVGILGQNTLPASCVNRVTLGVPELSVASDDGVLDARTLPSVRCFPAESLAYYVEIPYGNGSIAALGGASFASLELIKVGDNARFAWQLLQGRQEVVFGPPAPPGTTGDSLWQTVPDGARAFLWQLLIACVVIALVAGRRLGRSRDEVPLSPIPASELLGATSGLYRSSGDRAYAAKHLRHWIVARLARRVGRPGDDPGSLEAAVVTLGADPQDAAVVLTGPLPTTDQGLQDFARRAERLAGSIEGAHR